ncbi:Chemotaxis response regulator protein-glutamate methylesterase [Bacillus sp. THAF10]|uniref:protein-glutamate methylesterase/protein-glutamine glutaminase n=1 Tax=Bacillus sp. THAF10 TaxID=2587848 RepID=UPI001267B898|nr:chemotaxis response regulator protein-glutamate methylesterase [Bacillus sp. THAF10]QFT88886.1 Chemotaxis response regulator protein-glutamate methylesterase [Bacillus sp. THAF10]
MKKVKVLITDDSIFMRKLLSDMLSKHPSIEVIATANNGLDALNKINDFAPDVVTLDVEMPKMDGLEALKKIMKEHPLPVIMLSSTTLTGSLNTIVAMEYGAVDFVAKPSGAISLDIHKVKEELVEKILLASKTNIKTLKNFSEENKNIPFAITGNSKIELLEKTSENKNTLVCIGTSTGGPRALQTILASLPESFPAPILIVQHMPKHFTKSLANRLNTMSNITVVEAVHNQKVENATAYIAPGDYHMGIVKKGRDLYIHLHDSPPLKGHRPSVDFLFTSVNHLQNYQKIAVVLTGMGNDGTEGIRLLKQTKPPNTICIAESEETAVVYGMPKAALHTGLVDEVHPINDIAKKIHQYTIK